MAKGYAELKARHRAEREGYPQNLSLRVHRALSWLDRAEREKNDADARYIFLWIAFNAAYATAIDERQHLSEQTHFREFIGKLLDLDRQKHLDALVWQEFSSSIRLLIENKYVDYSFWMWKSGQITEEQWKLHFATSRTKSRQALGKRRTGEVLRIVLGRLYVLRNQLMHGGATWRSGTNRDQVRDGANLLGKLVPLIIELMMDNPKTLWGDAAFPVVD